MCNNCGKIYDCNCGCDDCDDLGCPVNLDFTCVFYHKDNNQISQLDGLNVSNGATLQLIVEAIDLKIRQLNVAAWSLTYLRGPGAYTINTLQQFGEAVDDELADLQGQITTLASNASVPLVLSDSSTINFSQSGTLNHTATGSVVVSPTAGNRLSILGDGLMATPQTLTANYETKKISITGGNEIDMLNFCGCEDCFGFLGNVTADPPAATNGQYWFRTDLTAAAGLKIKLNGAVRTITTS